MDLVPISHASFADGKDHSDVSTLAEVSEAVYLTALNPPRLSTATGSPSRSPSATNRKASMKLLLPALLGPTIAVSGARSTSACAKLPGNCSRLRALRHDDCADRSPPGSPAEIIAGGPGSPNLASSDSPLSPRAPAALTAPPQDPIKRPQDIPPEVLDPSTERPHTKACRCPGIFRPGHSS